MGRQPNFIVVIRGLKTGVFDDWIEAEEYCEPVRYHRGLWQGFPTREQAENRYQSALERGRVEVLSLPLSSSRNTTPPTTHTEPPTSSHHSPRSIAQSGSFSIFPEVPPQQDDFEVINHTQKVSISYPNDKKNVYFMPKEIKRSQSAVVQASPRDLTPVRRENSLSPAKTASRSPGSSSIGSVETALTSLTLHEVENVPQAPIRSQIPPGNALLLSPIITSPRLRTTEEVYASSNHTRSPRSPRVSPIKKSPSQLSSSASFPTRSSVQVNGEVRTTSPVHLRKRAASNLSEARNSPGPSNYRSPPKSESTNHSSTQIQGSSTRPRIPDVRSPLRKKDLGTFYDSCSSSGRPSPPTSRFHQLIES